MPQIPKHPKAWNIPARYKVTELLGSGSYGSVCEAEDASTNPADLLAIKQCKRIFEDCIDCKRILREISILSELSHNNVVKVIDFWYPEDAKSFQEVYIMMELCDSDLKKLIRQDVTLDPIHINTVLYNLLLGLNYIHSAGVYHRDLKPANCFVNRDCTVKIGDFGLSRAMGGDSNHLEHHQNTPRDQQDTPKPVVPHTKRLEKNLTSHVVTRWYRAPELILLQANYTEAIDVWSVGCIFAELLQMLPGFHIMDRGPLFPGSTCFPLSPRPKTMEYKAYTHGKHTMMNKIFEVIGTPPDEIITQVDREDARKYLQSFPKRQGDGLASKFPGVESDGLELLGLMLKFSAADRIKVSQALEHKAFSGIRDTSKETTVSKKVALAFETEEKLEEAELRKHFEQVMKRFHPEVA
jgi:mitogen-activated protein kinase 1/3